MSTLSEEIWSRNDSWNWIIFEEKVNLKAEGINKWVWIKSRNNYQYFISNNSLRNIVIRTKTGSNIFETPNDKCWKTE